MAPLVIPAAPAPAMARPTMKKSELCAAPQSSDPSSNNARKKRNVDYRQGSEGVSGVRLAGLDGEAKGRTLSLRRV